MRNRDSVLNHQAGEHGPIDQYHALGDLVSVLSRLPSEGRCRDEYTLPGTAAGESTKERLDVWAADRSLPAFRLDVDLLEAEAIESYDAVYATVAYTAKKRDVAGAGAVAQSV